MVLMGRAMTAPRPFLAVDNDTPLRLGVVAAQFGLTAAALRTEAKRGRLVISRVAGKDWTSVAEVQRMFGLCRSAPKESGFSFDRPEATKSRLGLSETAQSRSARDSLSLTLSRLKDSSPTTWPANISPTGRAARHRGSASPTF
jgi:hypothetical protein